MARATETMRIAMLAPISWPVPPQGDYLLFAGSLAGQSPKTTGR